MVIDSYTPRLSGCLQGYADITLDSGLMIRGIAIFERGGDRWTKLPSRRWKDRAGEWREEAIMVIPDRDRKAAWDRAVLAALDRYTGEVR